MSPELFRCLATPDCAQPDPRHERAEGNWAADSCAKWYVHVPRRDQQVMTVTEQADTGSNKTFAVLMVVLSLLIFAAVLKSEREN